MGLIPLEFLWEPVVGFIAIVTLSVGLIGALSRSMVVPSLGGYVTFVYLGLNSNSAWLEGIIYVTLTLVALGTAWKIWRAEATGDV